MKLFLTIVFAVLGAAQASATDMAKLMEDAQAQVPAAQMEVKAIPGAAIALDALAGGVHFFTKDLASKYMKECAAALEKNGMHVVDSQMVNVPGKIPGLANAYSYQIMYIPAEDGRRAFIVKHARPVLLRHKLEAAGLVAVYGSYVTDRLIYIGPNAPENVNMMSLSKDKAKLLAKSLSEGLEANGMVIVKAEVKLGHAVHVQYINPK